MTQIPFFSYDLAFDRNLGWLTEWEQLALRARRVAIAGMGGVGGAHLLTLARFGIGAFTIADFDGFELANFNRQAGATVATLGRPKIEVLEEMARAINPELHIRRFDRGVSLTEVDDFLDGADLFVDGLDFFEIPVRERVFARAAERGIPALTAAPLGMGAGFLAFLPGGMSFERYFRFSGQPEPERFLRFLLGLAPRGLHRRYLVDMTRVDLGERRGPSTIAACQLCAGVTAVAAVKVLLRRGGVEPAPTYYQYDAYRNRLATGKLRFGNAGPLQRLKLALARRIVARGHPAPAYATEPAGAARDPLAEILNLGRWAPSGDNAQPWRFRKVDQDTVDLRFGAGTVENVYEYRSGEPSWLSAGMLIETLSVAASGWDRRLAWQRTAGGAVRAQFSVVPGLPLDPLFPFLTLRSVDRRPYKLRMLSEREKAALAGCLDEDLAITWHEGLAAKARVARLNARATGIRLRIPETLPVHQRVIDWHQPLSPDGIPAAAIGLPRPAMSLMRWGMQDWHRTQVLNRAGAPLIGQIGLDYLPGIASGAFFFVRRLHTPDVVEAADLLRIGRSLQRLWLTATRLGLVVQPTMATIAFAWYGESGERFSDAKSQLRAAGRLAAAFRDEFGTSAREAVFLGRIGEPRPRLATSRSTRLPLHRLMEDQA